MELTSLLERMKMEHLLAQLDGVCEHAAKGDLDYKYPHLRHVAKLLSSRFIHPNGRRALSWSVVNRVDDLSSRSTINPSRPAVAVEGSGCSPSHLGRASFAWLPHIAPAVVV